MSLNCFTAEIGRLLSVPSIMNYYFKTFAAFCSNELPFRDDFVVHLGYDGCDLNTKLTGSIVECSYCIYIF